MDIIMWVVVIALLGGVAYFLFGPKKREDKESAFSKDEAHEWASREFRRAVANEKVVAVIADEDFEAFFLKLEDGGFGIYRSRRGKGQALKVEPGEYRLRALDEPNGLQVDFPEHDFFSGNYFFETEEDAADVSTWFLNAR